MQRSNVYKSHALALSLAALFSTGSALAEKPEWAGNNKGDKHEQKKERKNHQDHEQRHDGEVDSDRNGGGVSLHVFFGEHHHAVAHDYYAQQFHSGHCPPGLAKKHNGCMPPGQAKKWRIGRPLPRDVIYYDLPPAVVVQLGVPLPRHRYVRVAADILLIAIGTGMVVDAIEDLDGR
jgi:hypothetical protein